MCKMGTSNVDCYELRHIKISILNFKTNPLQDVHLIRLIMQQSPLVYFM